jgi:hypothetical protein
MIACGIGDQDEDAYTFDVAPHLICKEDVGLANGGGA